MSTYNCKRSINGIIVQNNPLKYVDPEGLTTRSYQNTTSYQQPSDGNSNDVYERLSHNPNTRKYYYDDPKAGKREVTPNETKIPGFDWDSGRNVFNQTPTEMPKKIELPTTGKGRRIQRHFTYKDSDGNVWKKDNTLTAWWFHNPDVKGIPSRNTYTTFRGTGDMAGSQVTYDSQGKIVDAGIGMGTFDYYDPSKNLKLHKKYDVDVRDRKNPNEYVPNLSTRN